MLRFMFKASNDAHVGLFPRQLNKDGKPVNKDGAFYEIVLGGWGNSQSVIRRSNQGKSECMVKGNICDTNNFVEMTIVYLNNGTIMIQRGAELGKNVLMQWQDPNPLSICEFAVMGGWGATG